LCTERLWDDERVTGPDADELLRAAAFRSELRRFLRRSDELVGEVGLTPQRYDLLLQLNAAPDGHSTVTELGKRAEEAGLVQRRRSERDRRVYLLELTADGDDRVTRVFNALRRDRADLGKAFAQLDLHFRAQTGD
jgi:DNA-binding MarR family transcriptional regulator